MTKINRNLSTPESRKWWRQVAIDAAIVKTWPEWKRAGISDRLDKFDSNDDPAH